MTIENTSVIDGVGVNNDSGSLTIMIADDLSWSNAGYHILCLQRKISACLDYINSGQYLEQVPDSQHLSRVIELVYKDQPDTIGRQVYDNVAVQLEELGIRFVARGLPVT